MNHSLSRKQNPLQKVCLHIVVFHVGYLSDVGLRGQADHDVQFLQFHIDGVVVLDKEDFDLLLQDLRPVNVNTLHIRLWRKLRILV